MPTTDKKALSAREKKQKLDLAPEWMDYDYVLNDQVRQVRWLYNNSNKCTMVYDEKLVRMMVQKLQKKIKHMEKIGEQMETISPEIKYENDLLTWKQAKMIAAKALATLKQ